MFRANFFTTQQLEDVTKNILHQSDLNRFQHKWVYGDNQ